ncbi:MAG TPA: lipoyl(octanoyl) transferase LipB [Cryomorphaceae bacterium]|nr:lipoyl(octanoyl) transferase LipB [Cryomorphaceae bacterium]
MKKELPKVHLIEAGFKGYQETWDYQEELFSGVIQRKIEMRKTGQAEPAPPNYLIFVEHPHVYTLGKSGKIENLLLSQAELKAKRIDYFKINRGGDITYHGPGQIVAYPIIDLDQFFTDIHRYLRYLEEAVILTLAEYGIRGDRYPGLTGVWLDPDIPERARKICALGVRCSRWVTMHGLAFNVNSHLEYFDNIIPCGIDDKSVTSMEKELGRKLDYNEVKEKLRNHLSELFEWKLIF